MVSAISEASFMVTQNKKTYTVNVVSGAKIINRIGKSIIMSDIQNGDKVSVSGKMDSTGMIMEASQIKDLSIPKIGPKKSVKSAKKNK